MNRIRSTALCAAVCCALAAPCLAGEAVVHWTGAAGTAVLETRISLPGPVTSAHLEAMSFRLAGGGAKSDGLAASPARPLAPTLVSGSLEGALGTHGGAAGTALRPRLEADWSGGRVTIAPLSVELCVLTTATFDGFIYGGESFLVDVEGGLSVSASVFPYKGDPDLYVWDGFGYLVCESPYPGKTRDACAVISGACANDFVTIDVYGIKKKNGFLLDVAVTEAY